jgi:SWI/SNF-related matrix-associated actin-dependent regulator 1 of chromatin subfamily A
MNKERWYRYMWENDLLKAKDLPDKQRQTIICDISNREEYNKAEADFRKWLEQQGLTEEEVTN